MQPSISCANRSCRYRSVEDARFCAACGRRLGSAEVALELEIDTRINGVLDGLQRLRRECTRDGALAAEYVAIRRFCKGAIREADQYFKPGDKRRYSFKRMKSISTFQRLEDLNIRLRAVHGCWLKEYRSFAKFVLGRLEPRGRPLKGRRERTEVLVSEVVDKARRIGNWGMTLTKISTQIGRAKSGVSGTRAWQRFKAEKQRHPNPG